MNNFFEQYISDNNWIIKEGKHYKEKQNLRESQFALGNGFIGSRGIFEETPHNAHPGTFISGLFDKSGAKVSQLVNLPNPITMNINIAGEKLDIGSMKVLEHSRYLNMKKGLLIRHTIFKDNQKNRIDYQSLRFISMHDKNAVVMQSYLTPLDGPVTADIESLIDISILNAAGAMEGKKRHFKIREVSMSKNKNYVCVSTLEKELLVNYITSLHMKIGKKGHFIKEEHSAIRVKKGQSLCLTKIINIAGPESRTKALKFKKRVLTLHSRSLKTGFDNLLSDHIRAWSKIWKKADVIIEPDIKIQRALRFNIYHLLICADKWNRHTAIGAKALSGEGYRGHIFWDSDIFILPFFIYTNPTIARNLLLYRYNRLNPARNIARDRGYKGAMFPWESADTGYEETPPWAKNLDGSIIKIYNHLREQHISADIAYAFYHYYAMTNDEKFMLKYGYEVIFEIARFWASRVEYNKRRHIYEMRHVIGPDEFHEDVHNNAFTNMLAKWNLLIASRIFWKIKNIHPRACGNISKKIGLNEAEVKAWKRIAPRIAINKRKDNIIEQFDGFFRKKRIKIRELDEDFMPVFPREASFKKVADTQLVKQADVLMLLFLLSDVYNLRTKKTNFKFYVPRTVHKSSLSHSVHSIIGAETGDLIKAYQFFLVSLNADLLNKHSNASDGIHAASLGGTWMAVIRGFAGVKLVRETLSIMPGMPRGWKTIQFFMNWQGKTFKITVTNNSVRIKAEAASRAGINIMVYNKVRRVMPGKEFIFYKEEKRK